MLCFRDTIDDVSIRTGSFFFIGNNELSLLLRDKNDRPRHCHVKTPFPGRSVCTKATSFWSGGIIVRDEFSIASLPISVQFVNSF